MFFPYYYPLTIIFALLLSILPTAALAAKPGDHMNVVPFGEQEKWNGQGTNCGVIWEDPRDIFHVVVTFADADNLPDPDSIRLEYWQSVWPVKRIPRFSPATGAPQVGNWFQGKFPRVGDWFQGKWLIADTNLTIDNSTYSFSFNPVNAREFPELKDFNARYRTTFKIRVVTDQPLPRIDEIEARTDSTWKQIDFEVLWKNDIRQELTRDGHLEVFNGILERVQPISAAGDIIMGEDNSWTCQVKNTTDGIRARILYANKQALNAFDDTVVTVRTGQNTFSFSPADLNNHGHMLLPDFGVIIRLVDDDTSYESAEQTWRENKNQSIYARVLNVEEQTVTRAWNAMPPKVYRYIPLGFEGGRQHFAVEPDGSAFTLYTWLHAKHKGRDSEYYLYEGKKISYQFGLSDALVMERSIVDGCLPMSITKWQRDGVSYQQKAFVVPLKGIPQAGERLFADDTLVLMVRFDIQLDALTEKQANLDIKIIAEGPENLTIKDGLIFGTYKDLQPLRMYVTSPDSPQDYELIGHAKRIAYQTGLTPDDPKRTVEFTIPHIALTRAEQWSELKSLRFEQNFTRIRNYWRERLHAGTQIVTPEPMITDFYHAHALHLLINTERQVGDSDRYMPKVATLDYGVVGNESCMMVSDMDRRGYHKLAEGALETWLHYQGTVGLPGDYSTIEGQFDGAGGYEAGGYNQNHGYILWCLAEHYWYTRDLDWLKNAAPKIIKGCDWIMNQRLRTVAEADRTPIRAIERGLLPPGFLEDIRDWRSWLATNVYSWWGMKNAALALNDANMPEGKRLAKEAAAYRQDILTAFTEAMHRSPVVQLRDGSWIPHMPSEVHRRGRSVGWIPETLEGAIHMINCGLIDPWDPLATWIMKDYEDNLYISEEYGYRMCDQDFKRFWFSRGGFSPQANLLCSPAPYLFRDEPEHFIRAYLNSFAVNYFADTRTLVEHAQPSYDYWWGGHYKASDESQSAYALRLMLVWEKDNELWIGSTIPRDWMADGKRVEIKNAKTYFGTTSISFVSHAAHGRMEIMIEPPLRNPPQRIVARFRHPESRPIKRCEVNGQPYNQFNPDKEWVVLDTCPQPATIVAYYD